VTTNFYRVKWFRMEISRIIKDFMTSNMKMASCWSKHENIYTIMLYLHCFYSFGKRCSPVNDLACDKRSEQACISANWRMPRQFEGCNWDWRKQQHDSRTNVSWKKTLRISKRQHAPCTENEVISLSKYQTFKKDPLRGHLWFRFKWSLRT